MGGIANYIIWRGFRFNSRTIRMIEEAESILGKTFKVSQGGFNNGAVVQSAGTHDGSAVDFSGLMSNREVLVFREVGFAMYPRRRWEGKWAEHTHGIPLGDSQLSSAARQQERDYRNGLNALANKAKDPFPRPKKIVTWEEYLRNKTKGVPVTDQISTIRTAVHGMKLGRSDNTAGMALQRVMNLPMASDVAKSVFNTQYREYVDENGNNVRDFRTISDILFNTHAHAVRSHALIAAQSKQIEMLVQTLSDNGKTQFTLEDYKKAVAEAVQSTLSNAITGKIDLVISGDGSLEITAEPDWVLNDDN